MGKKLAVIIFLLVFFLFAGKVTFSACSGASGGPCSGSCNLGQTCTVIDGYCGCQNVTTCPNTSDKCTSSSQCPSCGSSSGLCNLTTCNCGCNTAPGTGCCDTYSNWSPCSGGYQQRECQRPSTCSDTQQRTCTVVPTSTTAPPPPPPGSTNTPTPTAFIRVRVYKPNLTNLTFPNDICKVNCSVAPCAFPSCVSNDNLNDFAGAGAGRGGGINLGSKYVLLGVTPVQNGVVVNNGTFRPTCRGATGNRSCYTWGTALTTGSRVVRFVVATVTPTPTPTATPTPTPTPTATPTPGPWVKLKDSSYVSPRSLNNRIPLAPVAYDGTDTNQAFFMIDKSGVAMAPTVNVTGINPAAKTGNPEYKANYTPVPYAMTPTAFLGYVKARKEHKTITTLDDITEDGLYIYQGDLNMTSVPTQFGQHHVVLMTTGTVTIDSASFIPTKSVAILSNSLVFTPAVTDVKGVFVSNNVTTGVTVNQGLKVTGNLIAQNNLTNGRRWADANRPSLYTVFDPNIYIDVLPYLSTANYEWRQLQ